jgi:hypothetical protein
MSRSQYIGYSLNQKSKSLSAKGEKIKILDFGLVNNKENFNLYRHTPTQIDRRRTGNAWDS